MPDEAHAERALDSITVGGRHRKDLGDIDELASSIASIGLLQPITITPDGILVCGRRRLEAVRGLGWRTVKVWIRSGISNRLSELLAQQDENSLHKPLTLTEQAELYAELKALYHEEAQRKQEASRFGTGGVVPTDAPSREESGSGDSPEPSANAREARYQAAKVVTGKGSYQRLDHVKILQMVAADPFQHSTVRDLAIAELATVDAGGPVEPAYRKVRAAIELAAQPRPEDDDLARLGAEAKARVKQTQARRGLHATTKQTTGGRAPNDQPSAAEERPPKCHSLRSFLLTWAELDGWTRHYDLEQLAIELGEEEYARFDRVITESVAFRDRLAITRAEQANCGAAIAASPSTTSL